MSTETVLFTCSVIMCLLGVLSFIQGRNERAKNDGVAAEKLDSALERLDEIKKDLADLRQWRESFVVRFEQHEGRIVSLEKQVERIGRRKEN